MLGKHRTGVDEARRYRSVRREFGFAMGGTSAQHERRIMRAAGFEPATLAL